MTDILANLQVEVHPSKARLTIFLEGNCIFIASTVSVYCLQQLLQGELGAGSTNPLHNALYDHSSSRFVIAFNGMSAKTNPNKR